MKVQPLPVGTRFRDPLGRVYRFADRVLVRCLSCGGCATVLASLGEPERRRYPGERALRVRRRLRCGGCGLFKDAFLAVAVFGDRFDPYFRLPLWLQSECCGGHVLWAYNLEHLGVLESYVGARLRERGKVPGSMSMLERLPAWLKSAKHRDEVLRTIRRLRATAPEG